MLYRFSKFEAGGVASPQRLHVYDRLGSPVADPLQALARFAEACLFLSWQPPGLHLSSCQVFTEAPGQNTHIHDP